MEDRLLIKRGIHNSTLVENLGELSVQEIAKSISFLSGYKPNVKKYILLVSAWRDQDLTQLLSSIKSCERTSWVSTAEENTSIQYVSDITTWTSQENLSQSVVFVLDSKKPEYLEVSEYLQDEFHETTLKVDLKSLGTNLSKYKEMASESGIMAIVKANVYGSGVEVAHHLSRLGVDYMGVAFTDEGVALRREGIRTPIMVMNATEKSLAKIQQYELEPEVYSTGNLRKILTSGLGVPIHIKIETGMNRLGFQPSEISKLCDLLDSSKVRVQSVLTHFPSPENPQDDTFTQEQVRKFLTAYERIKTSLGYSPLKQVSNSAAIVRWPDYHFDLVRLGIGLHGYDPSGNLELQKVSEWKTTVSQIKSVSRGESIGYTRKNISRKNTRIAVIPVGYGDGFMRAFGNGVGQVEIRGEYFPTIGNVCMDMTMIDIGASALEEGEEVTLFGKNLSIEKLAEQIGTIPYEILTNVQPRVRRVFHY